MELKRPKHSKTKSTEKELLSTLEGILSSAGILTKITGGDDDFPTIDGYLHLLNEKREMIGQMMQVQVKPVRYKKDGSGTATCKIELFTHAYESSTPVLLIGVDKDNSVAYWTYLAPESVKSTLETATTKTITVNFAKNHAIKKGNNEYMEEWYRICLHHRNQANDKITAGIIRKRKKWSVEKQISTDSLESLDELIFYRTNLGEYPLFDYALSLAREMHRADEKANIRYIGMMEEIFYYRSEEVLKILFNFVLNENDAVAKKAKEILLKVSKYNFHILNSIGYKPHRLLVDSMKGFIKIGGESIRQISREILENVLDMSFDGTSHPNEITITFHRGALKPTPYLQRIRQDARELLFQIFAKAKTTKEKTEILSAMFGSLNAPDGGFSNEELKPKYFEMVNKEAAGIIKKYKKIIFPQSGRPTEEYPVIYEIERQIARLMVWKRDIVGMKAFLVAIKGIKTNYTFYRLMVGDKFELRIEEGYDVAQVKKEKDIQGALNSLTLKTAKEWLVRLEKVAAFKDASDFWKFNIFRDFLARIGRDKPEVAESMLDVVFKKHSALYPFVGSFLFGIRPTSITLWDKYVEYVKKDQSIELTHALLMNFEAHPQSEVKGKIRPRDIEIIKSIAKQENGFSFLIGKTDTPFLHRVMRTICYVYEAHPKDFRRLIVELLNAHPEQASLFFDQIGFAIWAKWFTLTDWQKEDLQALARELITVQKMGHNEELVVLELGQIDFDLMIDVFDKRIEFGEKKEWTAHYDALPNSPENNLMEFIQQHQNYPKVLSRWIENVSNRDLGGCIELSKFINSIGGPVLEKTIKSLIATGTKENLKRVLALFPFMEPPDFQLCFEMIAVTEDKDILRTISGKMATPGVVSGDANDDIFGNALKSIKSRLEKEGLAYPDKKVQDFCRQMIKNLEKDMAISTERHNKEMKERAEEFKESQL